MNQRILVLLAICLPFQLLAQARLSLYEEFTGEQCLPCTAANPGLQVLMAANPTKIIHIAYPSPLPVAGSIYNLYKTVSNNRISYYSIANAPQGRLNGTLLGTGSASPIAGHISNLTQSDINTAATVTAPFNLTVSHNWNATGDSVIAQISIIAPVAYAPSGAAFRLRLALVESLHFNIPPGINGEQDFPNTVREMYPNAGGTILAASWTTGQSTNFTVKGMVPKWVNKENANIVAWIQNDADKSIQQTALSAIVPIALDGAAASLKSISKLQCAAGSVAIPSVAILRNAGSSTLTSAKIYYHADGGPVNVYNWSGSLAPSASTAVQLSAVSVGGGNHFITDSVVAPNGSVDINPGNNVAMGAVNVFNTVGSPLPIANGFEGMGGATPLGWLLYDADSNGRNFMITKNIFGGNAGYGNSTYFLLHNNYYVPTGETNFAILPKGNLPVGDKMLSFALAHAPYDVEQDQLDVVYSTDCGDSWNSIWTAAGTGLTVTPATTSYFIPGAADWELKAVDVSAVPNGAIIAFRAKSDFGNSLYIDNVQLSAPAGIAQFQNLNSISIVPNPVQEKAQLQFSINRESELTLEVVDVFGRKVADIPATHFSSGSHRLALPLENLQSGVYFLQMNAGTEVYAQKFIKL